MDGNLTVGSESRADIAIALWTAGVEAVGGFRSTANALKTDPGPRPDQIVAVGKAAGAMTRAALACFGPVPALVVTKDGHGADLPPGVTLIEAAHPVPDARSLKAGRALREAVAGMGPGSDLLVLVSGGASALAEDLVAGYDLDDLIALNSEMLSAGLDITAMNTRRRQISQIKGGGLLGHFTGARVRVMAISDVPEDDLAVIGSGIGSPPETCNFEYSAQIIASNSIARDAAQDAARGRGIPVLINAETLHLDLDDLAKQIGPQIATMERGVLVLGGEPTVVLPPDPGQGGRNQALALTLARAISGMPDITIVVGGTDGSDGPTDAAGAVVDGRTWGAGAQAALDAADSGRYLDARGALLRTGPTGTNVMDLLIALRD